MTRARAELERGTVGAAHLWSCSTRRGLSTTLEKIGKTPINTIISVEEIVQSFLQTPVALCSPFK